MGRCLLRPGWRAVLMATAMAGLIGCRQFGPAGTAMPLPPPLGNADVMTMSANGLADETIIRSIQSQPTAFDVGPTALIDLKEQGVSDRVVQAMQARAMRPNPVAYVEPVPLTVIEPSIHFGPPIYVGRPHYPRYYRHSSRPRFSFEYSQSW